jgi:hypothetical protein
VSPYHPLQRTPGDDWTYGVAFLDESLRRLSPDLGERWHVRTLDGATYGVAAERWAKVVSSADLLLNVSGACLLRDDLLQIPRRVLIDTDPGLNHFVNWPRWDGGDGWPGCAGWREHDRFVTYAELIGQPECRLPDMGIRWETTRPVVVPELWQRGPDRPRWTTVSSWNTYRTPITAAGRTYGAKEVELARFLDLPGRLDVPCEIAGSGAPELGAQLEGAGWFIRDPVGISTTTADYRAYIESSRGELSVAKNVYVATRSGWFSTRSACYLAAGRPVVLQDTGFSEVLPTGVGLLAFPDADGAVAAVEAVESDYEVHSQAARDLACTHLDARRVLGALLDRDG